MSRLADITMAPSSQNMNADDNVAVVEKKARERLAAIIVALPILTVFLAANIPAEVVVSPDILGNGKYGPHFECYDRMTHGWPLVYASHDPVYAINGPNRSAWSFAGGNRSVSVLALLFDLVVAFIASIAAVHVILRWWSQKLLRFSLRTLFVAIVGVSVAFWWATSRWRLHQEQVAFLSERFENGATNGDAEWQPFGPLWLRNLTGDDYWSWGDHLVGIGVGHPSAMARIPGNRRIRVVRGWLDYLSPPAFEEFEGLEAIRIDGFYSPDDEDSHEEERDYRLCLNSLARCQSLAGLNLYDTGVSNRDLEVIATMSNLQNLELSANLRIDDQGLRHLVSLKKLRYLGVVGTAVTPAGVIELQHALPDCEIGWDVPEL